MAAAPDFFASTLACASPPVAPLSAKMINNFTDNTVCSDTTVNYTCNVGGVNAFRVIKLNAQKVHQFFWYFNELEIKTNKIPFLKPFLKNKLLQ